jgi:hypothetical protein
VEKKHGPSSARLPCHGTTPPRPLQQPPPPPSVPVVFHFYPCLMPSHLSPHVISSRAAAVPPPSRPRLPLCTPPPSLHSRLRLLRRLLPVGPPPSTPYHPLLPVSARRCLHASPPSVCSRARPVLAQLVRRPAHLPFFPSPNEVVTAFLCVTSPIDFGPPLPSIA